MLRIILATFAFIVGASASALAGGEIIHSGVRAYERAAVTKVGHRGRRCNDCDYRPARVYDEGRYYRSYEYRRYEYDRPPVYQLHRHYDPGVVYYGPAGAYRPYPPIIVYEVPAPTFYTYSREPYYHRVW
ncbi:MAG: hypothetical protein ACKVP3_26430 [Hyphomicrobiaceae bacterium]